MIVQSIRTHKQDVSQLPCSEFDDFLLQLYDKSQKLQRMSIDKAFLNHRCTRVNEITPDQENDNKLTSYVHQSPTDYLTSMFKYPANTKGVVEDLMSYRILNSVERTYIDGSITWRTNVLKNVIFSEGIEVIDETGFNNIRDFFSEASGVNLDSTSKTISIAMKLPKIWCIDCTFKEPPIFKHQFTLSIPQTDSSAKLERGVYQIVGCVSHSIEQHHYVACIFKNKKWVCMVCFSTFYSKITNLHCVT